jgi:hypothetical protein
MYEQHMQKERNQSEEPYVVTHVCLIAFAARLQAL